MTKTFKQIREEKAYMLSYGNKGDTAKFYYGNTFQDIQNKASELRKQGFVVDKMGKTQPTSQLRTKIEEIDVPKGHEYGPSSRKRPAGKAGYTSSDSARTTHLKTIKKWSKKKRRQGDKEFANEEVRGSLFKKGAKVKYVGNNPRYKGKTGTVANVHGTEDNVKYAITGFLKGTLAITLGAGDIRYAYQQREEAPANATGTAVAGTGDDSSTVLVKKRKELQKRLMRRFSIKETLDRILPDPVETEDEITTRKNQLKELAKRRK